VTGTAHMSSVANSVFYAENGVGLRRHSTGSVIVTVVTVKYLRSVPTR